jgi:cyclopropane-fatty-acyl-phospholipid synthase
MSVAKDVIIELAKSAGITLNGDHPWDIQVHNDGLYKRVLHQGSLGFGEAYIEGWWDCAAIDQMICQLMRAKLDEKIKGMGFNAFKLFLSKLNIIEAMFLNRQNKKRALIVGKQHYDIGNDLYQAMLDQRMVYTCAYWKNANNVDEAQEAKLKLVCDKLNLQPGQSVLDIGCGWGSFAKYAAENYGVSVVGITISAEQAALAEQHCQGLPIEIRLQDYRDVKQQFDHIVSLGMFEHVGYKNYTEYFKVAHRCLKESGLFLLHTIGNNVSVKRGDPWIDKYIFPNGQLPSLAQITTTCEPYFMVEDLHNFGADYDKTLMAWFANFQTHWPELQKNYDERFYRIWQYYLLSCAGSFRSRDIQLWQLVLAKTGVPGGYQSIR